MGIWTKLTEEGTGLFETLPGWLRTTCLGIVVLSLAIAFAATTLGLAYESINEMIPVTPERLAQQRLQTEARKLAVERSHSFDAVNTQMQVERTKAEIERAKAEATLQAHRISLGLPAKEEKTHETEGLSRLGDLVKDLLPTILAIMFAVYLLPAFATGDHWRLALIVSLIITMGGAFALIYNVIAETNIELKSKGITLSGSSTSVSIWLTGIGALLTAFCLFMNDRRSRGRKGQ